MARSEKTASTPVGRVPLIAGNWKMNLNHFEALKLVQQLSYEVTKDDVEAVDISVHPPFTDLRTVQTALESDRIPFALGAQHCHFEASGAFTGEVSPVMLAKLPANSTGANQSFDQRASSGPAMAATTPPAIT